MGLFHKRVEVSDTTETLLTSSLPDTTANSITIQIQNLGDDILYIGGENDFDSTHYGASIVPGGALTIDNLTGKDVVKALSASGTGYAGVLIVRRGA